MLFIPKMTCTACSAGQLKNEWHTHISQFAQTYPSILKLDSDDATQITERSGTTFMTLSQLLIKFRDCFVCHDALTDYILTFKDGPTQGLSWSLLLQ